MTETASPPRRSAIDRFLSVVEKGGNALPHPATLFALLALFVILLSGLAAQFDLMVPHPVTGAEIRPVNLLSVVGLQRIITGLVTNFTSFAPLGTVLVALIGIGVAEHSGLIGAALRLLVLSSPRFLLTPVIVFAGVMSNMASEIGYVLLVPLAGLIFQAAGRHPILGMAAAFAGVSGGYSANLLLGTVDPLLAGLSQEAARIIDVGYAVNPAANYYFMFVSTFVITGLGWFVTERIAAPRFVEQKKDLADWWLLFKFVGATAALVLAVWMVYSWMPSNVLQWMLGVSPLATAALAVALWFYLQRFERDPPHQSESDAASNRTALPEQANRPVESELTRSLGTIEKRGLRFALVATLLFTSIVLQGTVVDNGFLRVAGETDTMKALAPFLSGIVAIIFGYGMVAGIAYGVGAGTVRSDADVIKGMSASMATLGGYMVLVFFAAQFVAFFNWTQLGLIFAVEGAGFLKALNLPAVPLFMGFILLTAAANLFMGSASAKWALMAPVFVPMFMLLGYSPEMTQLAYRIGDSTTNIISPMMSYFALIIAFFQRYEPKAGIGTVVAVMLPYSIVFLIGWAILFSIWLGFDLPIGPGAPLDYIPAAQAG
ncbi:MAG: AbgT family transporter [Pseudomonas sp.]|nr:AbgT family transporter [Pseudomonas sp.]MDZ4348505.1 AbgT family transporter [Xanthomonadaceae bacterium]